MNGTLPLWPPIVAFVLGTLVVLHGRWESRRFDERMRRDFPEHFAAQQEAKRLIAERARGRRAAQPAE